MIDASDLFSILITRALNDVDVDLETFLKRAELLDMDADVMEQVISESAFSNSGGIFGRFASNFTGAAEATSLAAYRTGALAGEFMEDPALLKKHGFTEKQLRLAVDSGNTEEVTNIVRTVAAKEKLTWVAELLNTCHRCLPLHGTSLTVEQWGGLGFDPATIHEGWNSVCHCLLVRSSLLGKRKGLVAPLKRVATEGATAKGIRRVRQTARAVAQTDIDKSLQAVNEASQSVEGKRTLRYLGQARSAENIEDPFQSQFE